LVGCNSHAFGTLLTNSLDVAFAELYKTLNDAFQAKPATDTSGTTVPDGEPSEQLAPPTTDLPLAKISVALKNAIPTLLQESTDNALLNELCTMPGADTFAMQLFDGGLM
jgi:hypothetical protein